MSKDVSYVVLDEHTLGYLLEASSQLMGVLAGSALRGGHDWKNGPVPITPGDPRIRPATLADFETFRVVPPPGFAADAAECEGNRPC